MINVIEHTHQWGKHLRCYWLSSCAFPFLLAGTLTCKQDSTGNNIPPASWKLVALQGKCHIGTLHVLASMARPAPRPATHNGVTRRHEMWPPGAKSNTQTQTCTQSASQALQVNNARQRQTSNTGSNRLLTAKMQRNTARPVSPANFVLRTCPRTNLV